MPNKNGFTPTELKFILAMCTPNGGASRLWPTLEEAYRSISPEVKRAKQMGWSLQRTPEVQAEIQKRRAAYYEDLHRTLTQIPIANQAYRIAEKQARYETLRELLIERATRAPEGLSRTGLEVADYKGRKDKLVAKFDQAVLGEMRAIEDSVAKELGQIVEKAEVNGEFKIQVEFGDDPAPGSPSGTDDC